MKLLLRLTRPIFHVETGIELVEVIFVLLATWLLGIIVSFSLIGFAEKYPSEDLFDMRYKPNPKEDLSKAPIQGRLDVLAYQLGMRYAGMLEQSHNLQGLGVLIEPHVQELAKKVLGGLDVPPEAMIMLGIFQAGANNIPNAIPPKENK